MKQKISIFIDISLKFFGMMLYLIFYLLGWRFIFWVGKLTGNIIFYINRSLKKTTKIELEILFGEKYDDRILNYITKKSIEHYYIRNIETLFFGVLNKKRIQKIVHVEGLKNIEESLSKGKGIILLLSHFGSFLLPLPFLGFLGYKVNQITGKQLHKSLIEERIWSWRKKEAEKLPVKFIQIEKFLRPIYNALKKNEIIAIAFDGRDGSKWIVTSFYQRKALFSTGPFELARRTGAIIIPTFIIRKKKYTHKLIFEMPLNLSENSDIERALSEDTIHFAELLTNYIDKYPCHFGWLLFKIKKLQKAGIKYTLFQDK
jgi:Kdo2-lipid IVA lauroyltransferase/acyltransferase